MERLNQLGWDGLRFNCCDLDGRLVAVGSNEGKIELTEFILGDAVEKKVTATDIKWIGCPPCYSVLPCNGRILLVGQSEDEKSVISCLIDPFTGLEDRTGEIVEGSVSVEWLKVDVVGFEYGWYSELVRVGKRIMFSYCGGETLWELEVDEVGHRLTGRKLEIKGRNGVLACHQPISDHEMIVIGGYPPTDKVSLVDLDSGTVQPLLPLPRRGRDMSSTILFGRFVLVAGGHNTDYILGMALFDIQARKWSVVMEAGDWWSGGGYPPLSLSNGYIYIIEEQDTPNAHRISLDSLACLILNPGVRTRFMQSMGYSWQRIIGAQLDPTWSRRVEEIREGRSAFSCPVMM